MQVDGHRPKHSDCHHLDDSCHIDDSCQTDISHHGAMQPLQEGDSHDQGTENASRYRETLAVV